MFLALPFILFYKIRFLPSVNAYVPRFFLSLSMILPVVTILFIIYLFIAYASSILGDMRYNLGDTEKDFTSDDQFKIFTFIRSMDYINLTFREGFNLIILTIGVIFLQYIGSSLSKADKKAC
jgi:hypothetical protein